MVRTAAPRPSLCGMGRGRARATDAGRVRTDDVRERGTPFTPAGHVVPAAGDAVDAGVRRSTRATRRDGWCTGRGRWLRTLSGGRCGAGGLGAGVHDVVIRRTAVDVERNTGGC